MSVFIKPFLYLSICGQNMHKSLTFQNLCNLSISLIQIGVLNIDEIGVLNIDEIRLLQFQCHQILFFLFIFLYGFNSFSILF